MKKKLICLFAVISLVSASEGMRRRVTLVNYVDQNSLNNLTSSEIKLLAHEAVTAYRAGVKTTDISRCATLATRHLRFEISGFQDQLDALILSNPTNPGYAPAVHPGTTNNAERISSAANCATDIALLPAALTALCNITATNNAAVTLGGYVGAQILGNGGGGRAAVAHHTRNGANVPAGCVLEDSLLISDAFGSAAVTAATFNLNAGGVGNARNLAAIVAGLHDDTQTAAGAAACVATAGGNHSVAQVRLTKAVMAMCLAEDGTLFDTPLAGTAAGTGLGYDTAIGGVTLRDCVLYNLNLVR